MKKRKGLTLIELLLSLVLISFIIIGGTNFIIFGINSHGRAMDEFSIQSNIRLISQNVNNIIRDSSGVFLLNKEYPDNSVNLKNYFTEGWNYLMLNKDNTKLIEWVWDGKKHIERVVIDSYDGISYELTYDKESTSNENRLLKYNLNIVNGSSKRNINSELEGINTLQIIDRSYGKDANTLAYRSDPRLTDVGVAQAAVSFVIDKSGSMSTNDVVIGQDRSGQNQYDTRMNVLKTEATKMIETLAEYENVYLSISPFSSTANSSSGDNLNKMLNLKSNKGTFITNSNSIIRSLSANGGTNTGDGVRRGLSSIADFNNQTKNQDKTTKNFMIILVDGDTTFATATERVNSIYSETTTSSQSKSSITLNAGTDNERFYYYTTTTKEFDIWRWRYIYTHKYSYNGSNNITYYTVLHNNVGDFSGTNSTSGNPYYGLGENDYKPNGKVIGNGSSLDSRGMAYVAEIGKMVQEYRNTRDDGIEVFVIGFAGGATSQGLQQIADSTKARYGTHGNLYKYYMADTGEALETVLNEIKFQISEALWHIGGPN